MAQTHARTCQQQYTLQGIAHMVCLRNSVTVAEINAITVRMEILRTARFRKGEVVTYCRQLGLKLDDHNEGDAVMLWLWRRVRLGGRASARPGPLFGLCG